MHTFPFTTILFSFTWTLIHVLPTFDKQEPKHCCSENIVQKEIQVDQKDRLSHFKSFDGTKISYHIEGDGPTVILLHGFISNGSSWYGTELRNQLRENGFRVVIPDMRGNGKSDIPQIEDAYMNDSEVKDIKLLADHLKLNSYSAIGYSRGSIVLAKVLTIDQRIDKAVLGGMGIDFTKPDWDRKIMFRDAFLGTASLNEDTEGAVNYAKSIDADLRVLGWLQKHQPVTSKSALEAVATKVMIIAGDLDNDNGDPKKLKKHLKNSKVIIVPGDHNTTYRKKPFADAVLQFMQEI